MTSGTGISRLLVHQNLFCHAGLHEFACDGRNGVVDVSTYIVIGFKGKLPGLHFYVKLRSSFKLVAVRLSVKVPFLICCRHNLVWNPGKPLQLQTSSFMAIFTLLVFLSLLASSLPLKIKEIFESQHINFSLPITACHCI